MTALVGIDVGTSGVKAIALSETGEVVARAEREYPLSTPQPGWAEQDPHEWARAADQALADLGVEPDSIGWSGQMHGLVVLDEHGEVIRPAILWNDQRTAAECAEIEERIGFERLIRLTGNRALTGFTAPKLLWLRTHEPDAYARIRHVLLPKDYVRFRRTGEHAIDVADASGTLLFDVANRRWSDEVLDALELPAEWLPPSYESTEIAGAGDQAAGALGVGIVAPGTLSVVLGTSGVVFSGLDAYRPEPEARLHTFCHAVPGTWHAMGVMLSAAGSLQWLQRTLDAPYETLLAEAADVPPGSEGLLFQPYLQGERTPHADPDARGAFVGLTLRHGRGHLTRAVLEGVAYGLRDSRELLKGVRADAALGRASGGGARSELWLKIVASVLAMPLARTEVEEGAAYGAALLGAVKEGVFADARAAVEATVRVRDWTEPNIDWQAAYDDGYARYRQLYPTLRSLG
ncbi:MAG: xylulokinase [Thermoleophilia bacterium]|nr:xylulokinase [Thermoleophilia bacterium]